MNGAAVWTGGVGRGGQGGQRADGVSDIQGSSGVAFPPAPVTDEVETGTEEEEVPGAGPSDPMEGAELRVGWEQSVEAPTEGRHREKRSVCWKIPGDTAEEGTPLPHEPRQGPVEEVCGTRASLLTMEGDMAREQTGVPREGGTAQGAGFTKAEPQAKGDDDEPEGARLGEGKGGAPGRVQGLQREPRAALRDALPQAGSGGRAFPPPGVHRVGKEPERAERLQGRQKTPNGRGGSPVCQLLPQKSLDQARPRGAGREGIRIQAERVESATISGQRGGSPCERWGKGKRGHAACSAASDKQVQAPESVRPFGNVCGRRGGTKVQTGRGGTGRRGKERDGHHRN